MDSGICSGLRRSFPRILWIVFGGLFSWMSVGFRVSAAVDMESPDRLEARGEIVLYVEHIQSLMIAVQPELVLRAHSGDGTLEIHGVWSEESAGLGPYLASAAVGDTSVQVWGGGYRNQRWADDQNLVALVGVEHGGPRLRMTHGSWGLDYTAERTGVRWQWEGKGAAGVHTKAGALLIAGLPPPDRRRNRNGMRFRMTT